MTASPKLSIVVELTSVESASSCSTMSSINSRELLKQLICTAGAFEDDKATFCLFLLLELDVPLTSGS
ncbi:hypothetical protein Tco_0609256 [Tanacetum coccineum]